MILVYLVVCLGTAKEATQIVQKCWNIPVFWTTAVVIASAALPAIPDLFKVFGYSELLPDDWKTTTGRLAFVCVGNWLLAAWMGTTAILTYRGPGHAQGWLVSTGLLLFVSAPLSVWWILRQIDEPALAMFRLIGIALVTKMADTGAYFAGRSFGRNKLAPVMSPKKTWEGLIGGWITAALVAVCYFGSTERIFDRATGWFVWGPILLASALTWFGLFGDLAESMMKRSGEVKDSGSSLPGLGGVWDVTDSLIPAPILGLLAIEFGLI